MDNPIKQRVEYLIDLCGKVLVTRRDTAFGSDQCEYRIHNKYKAAGLSFFKKYYGEEHPYYASFHSEDSTYGPTVESSLGVLEAVLDEIENGWYQSVRSVVSAEVFSDFVEMANHLLEEGYKDAAAVMLGSTLEEHLRQLARENDVQTEIEVKGIIASKKADVLNADLVKAGVYSKLDQKNVTAWLGLRNSAAHGKYGEYSEEQVVFFSQALVDFMARSKEWL
jgi:hypothetical protein